MVVAVLGYDNKVEFGDFGWLAIISLVVYSDAMCSLEKRWLLEVIQNACRSATFKWNIEFSPPSIY